MYDTYEQLKNTNSKYNYQIIINYFIQYFNIFNFLYLKKFLRKII